HQTLWRTDITDRRVADQKLKKNYNELIRVRESLKSLNTELEEKVHERTQRLTESETRFNQVSKATNDTIWDWNLVDNSMWRSDSFTAMFGYTQSEENSSITFWFDKIHEDDQQRVRDSVYAAINSKDEQWSAEYRLMKADGEYAVILDRGTILQDEFEMPYRMIGSMIDITKLVDTENKLSSSERKFRKVFDSNVIGMLFSNIETGRIDEANDAFLRMIGYTQDDIHSADGLHWNKITPEEYMPVSLAAVKEIEQHGVCPPFEKQYLKKNGDRISVMLGSALLYEDNKHEVVTYIIDITEQKQAERRRKDLQKLIRKQQAEFYSIFKNAPALISIRRGKNLKYEFVNTAFVEFNGDQEYIGKPSDTLNPGFESGELKQIEDNVLAKGETFVGKAFQVERLEPVTGERKTCWFDLIFAPVYSDFGDVDGIAFFGFDVTDLVLAQQATKDLMNKKDEFMSIASHELKTPITSIKGYLQIAQRLAERSSTDSQILSFVDKANRQVGKLTTLVEDLLDVTR
ncbi:MAG: PAS domain S-box protein, partial [Pedobacter sp.]